MASAVKSASVREGVGVGSTVITIFSSLFDSVTAVLLAARASVVVNIVVVVTFFASISHTVTAEGISAVKSASIRLGVTSVLSGIALFATKVISDTITTEE